MNREQVLDKYVEYAKANITAPYFNRKQSVWAWHNNMYGWVKENIDIQASTFLEFGCALGQWGISLHFDGCRGYTGIDNNENFIKHGIAFAKSVNIPLDLRIGDAMKYRAGEYDVVAPLNFAYEDPIDIDRLIENCGANLKAGGHLIVDIMDVEKEKYTQELWEKYTHKYSEPMMKDVFSRWGVAFIERVQPTDDMPRSIYIGRKHGG